MDRTQVARAAATRGPRAAAIRPVSPADEAVLREFFAALSVESRYLRFFAPVTPSCGLLDLMAGKPAHVDAIIAVSAGLSRIGTQSLSEAQIATDALRPLAAVVRSARVAALSAILEAAWQR